MFSLIKSASSPVEASLEAVLQEMEKYGCPRLKLVNLKSIAGWHCAIDMDVSLAGASFEIKSEYEHSTPLSAVLQCRERVYEALGKMKKRWGE